MKFGTNERSFSRLPDVFTIPAPMTNRHRSWARPANVSSECERFCKEWLAQRTWEDDGGRVVSNLARVAG